MLGVRAVHYTIDILEPVTNIHLIICLVNHPAYRETVQHIQSFLTRKVSEVRYESNPQSVP